MKINKISTPTRISKIAQTKDVLVRIAATPAKQSVKQTERQSSSAVTDNGTSQVLQKAKNDTAPARTIAATGIILLAQRSALKKYDKYMDGVYVNENKQVILKTDMGMKAMDFKSDEVQELLKNPNARADFVTNKEAIANTISNQGIQTNMEAFEIGQNSLTKQMDLSEYGGISTILTQNTDREAANVIQLSKNYKSSYGVTNRILVAAEKKKIAKEAAKDAIENHMSIEEFIKAHPKQAIENNDPLNPNEPEFDKIMKKRKLKAALHKKTGKEKLDKDGVKLKRASPVKPRKKIAFIDEKKRELKKYTSVLLEQEPKQKLPTRRDRKLVKGMGKRAKRIEQMNRFTKKSAVAKRNIKGFARIWMQPFNQSEAMKGYRLTQPLFASVKATAKLGGKATGRIAFKTIKQFKTSKAAKDILAKSPGISKKAARKLAKKQIEKSFGAKYTKDFFKNKIKSKARSTLLDAIANATKDSTGALAQSVNAQVRITKDFGIDGKGAAKRARKAYRKDMKMQKLAKKNPAKAAKMQQKAAKKAAKKAAEKQSNLLKIGQRAFKKAQEALKAIMNFIKGIIKAVGSFAGPALPAVLVIIATIGFLLIWYVFMGNYAVTMSSVVWFDGEEAQTSQFDQAMAELQFKHSDMEAKIKAEQEKYEVADIQYTNGTQENYKEILAATHIIFNDRPFDFSNDEVYSVIDNLYDKTHKITTETYTFKEKDGTEKTAAHVFVNIKRNEELCYSVLDGVASSGGSSTITASYCPSGSVVNDDWMNIVKTMKSLIASTGTEYSQTTTVPVSVDGTVHNVRPDCSGYVSICLDLFGSINPDQKMSSYEFVSAGSIKGFTKYAWSGWDTLQEGDIIATNGHVEIFAYNSGGHHYVYSNGSTESVRTPGVTTDNASYMVVWRPNSPGSTGSGSDTGAGSSASAMAVSATEEYLLACIIDCESGGEPYQGQLAVGSVILNRVASPSFPSTITDVVYQEGQFAPVTNGSLDKKLTSGPSNSCVNAAREVLSGTRVVNNLYFLTTKLAAERGITGTVIGNHMFHGSTVDVTVTAGSSGGLGLDATSMIKFSNMPSVDFDKQDNQTGYETAIRSTVSALSASSKYSNDNYDDSNSAHYKSDDTQSSLDFVRAVYANHGVDIALSVRGVHDQFDIGSYDKLAVGDIILARPMIDDAWTIFEIDKAVNKADNDTDREAALAHYNSYIPMVYIGDNKAVAYSRDLKECDDDYTSSSAAVRTYTIGTDVKKSQISEIRHVTKMVNNPVYGSDNFFCGWTDEKIAEMITCLNQNYWVSKKIDYTGSKGDTISIDFFSTYVEDFFSGDVAGNSVYYTDSHVNTFITDISRIALLSYEDYEILPSTLVADAALKSNNRTTEESLKYFNIFEMKSSTGAVVDKYTYDSSGNPTISGVGYATYVSLEDALDQHCIDMNSKYSLGSATSYSELTSTLASSGYCTTDYATQMNAFIVSNGLTNLDTIALTRKAYMDDAQAKLDALNSTLDSYSSSTTSSGYLKIKDAENALSAAQKTMDDYIASTDTSTVKSLNLDNHIKDALEKSAAVRESMITNQVKRLTDQNTSLSELITSYSGRDLTTDECKKLGQAISKTSSKRDELQNFMKEIGESRDEASNAITTANSLISDGEAILKKQIETYVTMLDDAKSDLHDAIDKHAGKKTAKKSDYDALMKASDDGMATYNTVETFVKYSELYDARLDSGLEDVKALSQEAYKDAKKLDAKRKTKITLSGIYCSGHYYTSIYTLYHSEKHPKGRIYKTGETYDNYLGTDFSKIEECDKRYVTYTDGWD